MSARPPLVLATRSPGKLRELRPIFEASGVHVIDLGEAGIPESDAEDDIEAYDSFEENALAKARHFFALAGGANVVADDSGLVVEGLGGAPGVHSKRWSGRSDLTGHELDRANNEKLLASMRGVVDRRARFVCAAAWCGLHGELVVRGEVPGSIVDSPSGDQGFGYDPFFYSSELGMTLADATIERKRLVSHRGRAFDALLSALHARGVLRPVEADALRRVEPGS